MSDQRPAIAEFCELEQRRLAGSLTSAEEARHDWLRRVLGAGAGSSQPASGFDMGAAATDLHESLQPAGMRTWQQSPAPGPAPEPMAPDGAPWDELGAPEASSPAPFPDGGFDASWLSEDPEHEAAAPAVRPQAWNPAAPGYDPEAPYDEAAWIAAGYDPNVTYDWSASVAEAQDPLPAPPGSVVTAPAIPLPSSQVPGPELPAEEDLPTLDVLSLDELPAAGDPGQVEAALSPVAAPDEDDGWPGFELDAVPTPVAPAPAGLAGAPLPLDELLPSGAPPPPIAEQPPTATAAGEGVVFDDLLTEDGLLSDDELLLLASGGAAAEPAPRPVPQEPVAAPPPEAVPLELLGAEVEAGAAAPEPLQLEEVPEELVQSWAAEPLVETAAPPHDALPPLPLPSPTEADADLPPLTPEAMPAARPGQPVQAFVPKPLFDRPAGPAQPTEPEPLHPPLPEAVQANVFVPPRPVFAVPAQSVTPAPLPSPRAEPAPAPVLEPPMPAAASQAPEPGPEPISEPLPEALPEPRPEAVELLPAVDLEPEQAAPPEAPALPAEPLVWPEPALPESLLQAQASDAEPSVALDHAASGEGWPREPVFTGAPPAGLAGSPSPSPAPALTPLPAFGATPPAPAQTFAPPAWPPLGSASAPGAAAAGFGAYDEPAIGGVGFAAGGPLADPLAGAWDAGGEPTFDPAIQPYEPAPPGAPLGEYDDLPSPSGLRFENMLPFDPAAAAAIPPGSIPEGYEAGPPPELVGSMELELPGRPVAPAEVGPVAELSEVSAEWQPDAALARGFDLASEGSFGLPELSLGDTPWPPLPPPSEPPIALAPPAAPTPPLATTFQPPPQPFPAPSAGGDEGLEELSADELIEVEPAAAAPAPRSSTSTVPATPTAPATTPASFVAPAAGLFAAAGTGWKPPPPASAPPPRPTFVAPAADLYARTPATTPPQAVPPPSLAAAASPRPAREPDVQLPRTETRQPVDRSRPGMSLTPPTAFPAIQTSPPQVAPPPPEPAPLQPAPPIPPSGRWSNPAAPIVPRLKATPPQAPAPAAPASWEVDLEPLPPLIPTTRFEGSHRVLVHTIDGEVKRGVLESPSLDGDRLSLRPLGPGSPLELATDAVKAVFFLLGPGESPPGPNGRKIRVTFRDGRQVAGYSPDYQEGQVGFLLIPVEARTTTARIWVYQASVRQVVVG